MRAICSMYSSDLIDFQLKDFCGIYRITFEIYGRVRLRNCNHIQVICVRTGLIGRIIKYETLTSMSPKEIDICHRKYKAAVTTFSAP
jgi:hypothetical protein